MQAGPQVLPADTPSLGWRKTFSALGSRDFRFLWAGMSAAFVAGQMQQMAGGYLAYTLTGSALALGAVLMAWGVPMIFLAPLGGALADRVAKRQLLLWTQGISGLTALATGLLIQADWIQLWHLIALGLVQGVLFAFYLPARQAFVPVLVAETDLAQAIALNNAAFNLSRVLGPALAGVLLELPFPGLAGIYYLMAAFYVLVLLSLLQIAVVERAPRRGGATLTQDMVAGVRYLAGNSALLSLLVLAFLVVALGFPYQILLPVFALRVLEVGASGLGLLNAATGLGALLGSLGVAYLGDTPHKERLQRTSGVIFGLSLVLFGAAPFFWLAVVAMVISGATSSFYLALNNTLLLINSPREMHGRVMSLYLLTFSVMPLVALPISALADLIGAPFTVMGQGVVIALVLLATTLAHPPLSQAKAGKAV